MYMYKKFFLSIIVTAFCFIFVICCKKPVSLEYSDIVGTFSWSAWQEKSGWKDYSASDYLPDNSCVEDFKLALSVYPDVNFEIYASNWCLVDCATQLPKIIKFLKAAGVSENDIIIYGLNRTKTDPTTAINKWKNNFPNEICRVPSLIIYAGNNFCKIKCETSDFPEWQCQISDKFINMVLVSAD